MDTLKREVVRLARELERIAGSDYMKLVDVARSLNSITRMTRVTRQTWEQAQEVISASARAVAVRLAHSHSDSDGMREERSWFDWAVEGFRQMAEKAQVRLTLEKMLYMGKDRGVIPYISAEPRDEDDVYATIVCHVWTCYFGNPQWRRLKRCPRCRVWFVDTTRNMQKKRCSAQCTWRSWNRARRKAAGHSQYQQRTRDRHKAL